MKIKVVTIVILYFVTVILFGYDKALSQELKTVNFNYVSPTPNSKFIMPQNNIVLRHGDPIVIESLQNFNILVKGSISGIIMGRIILSSDSRTVIFVPDKPFAFGEEVQVSVFDGLETKSGLYLGQEFFSFTVTPAIPKLPKDYFLKKELAFNDRPTSVKRDKVATQPEIKNNNLPEDFPEITVNLSEDLPPEGYYFVAPFTLWGWYPEAVPYLIIMDKYGVPVFYRKNPLQAFDFKKLYNGNLVYYANFNEQYKWIVEDDTYQFINEWSMKNGYWTDWHEFQLLSEEGHEGHAFVMANDPQFVDMSQIVPGGNPNAIVVGWVIQEQDVNKNVIFQWRSWDHFLITDADDHVDLTDSNIDPFHGNAIEVYSSNELLLSTRNLNEITKINWNTGDIIWRLGGENNMFEFENDTIQFSRQHDCRRLSNGNLSLFDNGTYHTAHISSAVEYALDEVNYTATLENRFQHNPDAYGEIMGNAQESNAGNIIVGWGSSGAPAITEFDPNGEILAEINIESINYRAYRFPWETSTFSLDADILHFGYIYFENEVTKTLKIQNNMNFEIEISSFYSMDEAFSISADFPIVIPPGESKSVPVKFAPSSAGNYHSVLTINSDINNAQLVQRIAQQVYVAGDASENQNIADYQPLNATVFPNPVIDNLYIEFDDIYSVVNIQILDAQSKTVYSADVNRQNSLTISLKNYTPGVYSVLLKDNTEGKISLHKIIKQ